MITIRERKKSVRRNCGKFSESFQPNIGELLIDWEITGDRQTSQPTRKLKAQSLPFGRGKPRILSVKVDG